MQPCEAGARLISLPRRLQLTYDAGSDAALLALISRVPEELWGAKLALQARPSPSRMLHHVICTCVWVQGKAVCMHSPGTAGSCAYGGAPCTPV